MFIYQEKRDNWDQTQWLRTNSLQLSNNWWNVKSSITKRS